MLRSCTCLTIGSALKDGEGFAHDNANQVEVFDVRTGRILGLNRGAFWSHKVS